VRGDGPDVRGQLLAFAREIREAYGRERELAAELQAAQAQLDEACLSAIQTLAYVVEAKDAATGAHLARTRRTALDLTRRVDPELAERPETGYGFLLHDIGKVGVPEAILGKEGPLAVHEWELMQAHPAIGAQIVAPMTFLGGAVDMIHSHHERFDGGGYPRGLRGEQIPLTARIFAVADAFDAMTHDRPYRRALRDEQAVEEITGGAGTQFDPDIVRVFVDLRAEPDGSARVARAG
jgi:HD-GYP domain-containing protein (c-di-GMP phosphodiesterase class II)